MERLHPTFLCVLRWKGNAMAEGLQPTSVPWAAHVLQHKSRVLRQAMSLRLCQAKVIFRLMAGRPVLSLYSSTQAPSHPQALCSACHSRLQHQPPHQQQRGGCSRKRFPGILRPGAQTKRLVVMSAPQRHGQCQGGLECSGIARHHPDAALRLTSLRSRLAKHWPNTPPPVLLQQATRGPLQEPCRL